MMIDLLVFLLMLAKYVKHLMLLSVLWPTELFHLRLNRKLLFLLEYGNQPYPLKANCSSWVWFCKRGPRSQSIWTFQTFTISSFSKCFKAAYWDACHEGEDRASRLFECMITYRNYGCMGIQPSIFLVGSGQSHTLATWHHRAHMPYEYRKSGILEAVRADELHPQRCHH